MPPPTPRFSLVQLRFIACLPVQHLLLILYPIGPIPPWSPARPSPISLVQRLIVYLFAFPTRYHVQHKLLTDSSAFFGVESRSESGESGFFGMR